MAPSLEVLDKVAESLPVNPLKGAKSAVASGIKFESTETHDRVLKVFRAFIADLCQQFNGGHPGYVFSDLKIFKHQRL
jgi:dihydroxyacetone synthase